MSNTNNKNKTDVVTATAGTIGINRDESTQNDTVTQELKAVSNALDLIMGELNDIEAITEALKEIGEVNKVQNRPKARRMKVTEADLKASTRVCLSCGVEKDASKGFSVLKRVRLNRVCKVCRSKATAEWTKKRSDFRKAYHKAIQLQHKGIPALPPSAKTWKQGDPILTTSGENAEALWQQMKADKKAGREKAMLEAKKSMERLRTQRREAKLTAKEMRLAEQEKERQHKAKLRLQKKAEKAEAKARLAKEKAEARLQQLKAKAEERAKLALEARNALGMKLSQTIIQNAA